MATGLKSYALYSSGKFRVSVDFEQTYDSSTGISTVKIIGVYVKSNGYYGYKYYPNGSVQYGIVDESGGTTWYSAFSMSSSSGSHYVMPEYAGAWYHIRKSSNSASLSKSFSVKHNTDGTAKFKIYVSLTFYTSPSGQGGSPWSVSGTKTFDLTPVDTFTINMNPGDGSVITVNRTATTYTTASTGSLENGSTVYSGDTLAITYTPDSNYKILSGTVNDAEVVSDSETSITYSHTVDGDVTVGSSAQPLASPVSMSSASMNENCTITITPYVSDYTHRLYYTLIGINTTDGGEAETVLLRRNSISNEATATTGWTKSNGIITYSWKVPDFYSMLASYQKARCVVICETYNGSNLLGESTTDGTSADAESTSLVFDFTSNESAPLIYSVSVIDDDDTSILLTGNSSTIVRYLSAPVCTFTANAQDGATLTTLRVSNSDGLILNTVDVSGTGVSTKSLVTYLTWDDWNTGRIKLDDNSAMKLTFSATDSRGSSSNLTKTVRVVPYIYPIINAEFIRTDETTGGISLSISESSYYNGYFTVSGASDGVAAQNDFVLQYRYKNSSDTSFGEWVDIFRRTSTGTSYTYPDGLQFSSNTFSTASPIQMNNADGTPVDCAYNKSFVFEARIVDSAAAYTSDFSSIKPGAPVFDWGENDFNFNVPVTMPDLTVAGKNLGDIASGLDDVKSTSAVTLNNDGKVTAIGGNEIAHPAFPTLLSAFTNDMSFISYKVLWENQNTVDENGEFVGFEATELTSADFSDSLSNYNLFLIAYRMNSDNPIHLTTVHWVTELGAVACESTYTRGGDGTRVVRQRAFTMNRGESTISFETGIYTQTSSSTGSTIMVPLQIVGIRFPVITS